MLFFFAPSAFSGFLALSCASHHTNLLGTPKDKVLVIRAIGFGSLTSVLYSVPKLLSHHGAGTLRLGESF